MPNSPILEYRPGLTLDTPVAVTMAAADWLCMMTWFSQIDQPGALDGVKHLVYGIISPQVADAVHTPASRKYAQSLIAERHQMMGVIHQNMEDVVRQMQHNAGDIVPEDFNEDDDET